MKEERKILYCCLTRVMRYKENIFLQLGYTLVAKACFLVENVSAMQQPYLACFLIKRPYLRLLHAKRRPLHFMLGVIQGNQESIYAGSQDGLHVGCVVTAHRWG